MTDIVILFMGLTGSGKSNFINKLTGQEKEIGADGLMSCTNNIREFIVNTPMGRYVFVDTPAFDHTFRSDCDILRTITGWLAEKYREQVRLSGIIYTHGMIQRPTLGSMIKDLDILGRLCGDKAIKRVCLVTTEWDMANDLNVMESRVSQLEGEIWKPLIGAGARHRRFKNTFESAWAIICDAILGNSEALLIQEELVDEERNLSKTTVGKCFYPQPHKFLQVPKIQFSRSIAVFKKERRPRTIRVNRSAENVIPKMIDKLHMEMDLDTAVRLGRVAVHISGQPHRSEFLKTLIELLMQRFHKQDAISDLDELVMLHRDILELHPPDDKARPSLLHDSARYLCSRFQRQGRTCDLEEAIAFERAALQLHQHGHAGHAESLYNLVRFHGEYRKAGKATDVGELTALGRTLLELGPSDHADYMSSLTELALCILEGLDQQAVTVDVQEAITLTDSVLKLCPTEHPGRPVLLKAIVSYRRKKLKSHAQADRDVVAKLVGVAVYNTLETLPTRLLNTLTGRLCGRDELMSDFDNSAQYKELLESATNSHPPQHEYIRETVSSYFQYATLSHRWGSDEPVLRDVQGQVTIYDIKLTHGIIKLQAFCADASNRGYRWAWSDTCCIDKESSAELQEAIGSMFRWYRRSALTIVHLADVSDTNGALSSSVWFKRGWTLQELLAPRAMLFFTQDWSPYRECSSSNHKEDSIVLAELEKVTNIARHHLTDFNPGTDDARSRLQWASTRRTTRPEDMAYSLFGVFNLHLPVLYGEPKENALGRLLAEIISQSGDISVLDWVGEASPFHSCFPAHIAVYRTLPFPSSHADQIQSSMPNVHELVSSSQSPDSLFTSLSKLDPPYFIGRRLKLPCIVHRVIAINPKQWEHSTSSHAYDIQAEGLTSLQIVLPNEFKNDSLTTLPYALVRPWHPKLLHSSTVVDATASEQLAMTLGQPFHALLLEELPQNEYRRVASSSVIIACAAGAASILSSNVQTLNIV